MVTINWGALIAICAAVVTISEAIKAIIGAVKAVRKPEQRQDEQIQKLDEQIKAIEEKLGNDKSPHGTIGSKQTELVLMIYFCQIMKRLFPLQV